MNLKRILASVTAAALTCCMTAALMGVQAEESSEKLRVMPLGDSITDGFNIVGGYRVSLWKTLEANGYTDGLDFVGPNWGGDGIDPNHAGFSGYSIADIPGQRSGIYNFIDYLMTEYPADVVMLQIGTNDILSSYELDTMGDRLELLVDAVLGYLPEDGLLYVATIPYMDADVTYYTDAYTAEEMDAAVDAYNDDVKALVARKQAEGKQIALSDINSVLTKADLADGVHPNQEGYDKMGAFWYGKLLNYINGSAQPPEPSTEPTTETTESDTTETTAEETTQESTTDPTELPTTEATAEETTSEVVTDEPTSAPTEATTEEIPVSKGDLNSDNAVNIADVILLQKYLLGVETLDIDSYWQADVYADGVVDVFDLAYLKRMVLFG